jgi:SAM-dependent methyltransferase
VIEAAWEAIAGATEIDDGTSLLDLGCGDGSFCAFAARRGAIVHGVDAEPDAIAAAMEAVAGADLRLGLMESLPWADASFDVVTSFNGLQYALDPEVALAEASRVARPDGRIAICKWGHPAENDFFAFLTSISAGGVRADRLPATDPVESVIRASRLEVITSGHVAAPIAMADDVVLETSLARARIDIGAGTFATEASVGREASLGVEPSVSAAAAPYRRADGTYRFNNRLRFWVLSRGRA